MSFSIKNENVEKFYQYLKKFKIDEKNKKDAQIKTHYAFGDPWGSYNIPDERLEEFETIYARAAEKISQHIIAVPKENSQFLIDIDFDQKTSERQYTEKTIRKTIKKTVEYAQQYFDIKNKSKLLAIVYEKKQPSLKKEGVYKDGFHIVFPRLILPVEFRYILTYLLRESIRNNNFIATNVEYINSLDTVIDTSIVKTNGWCMHGSLKNKGMIYNVTKIYDGDVDELEWETKYTFEDLVKLTSNRKNLPVIGWKDCVGLSERKQLLELAVPSKKKSINQFNDEDTEIKEIEERINSGEVINDNMAKVAAEKIKNQIKNRERTNGKIDDITLATELTEILSVNRADNYETWVRVGWALHNIHVNLLNVFKEFSKKCKEKYNERACEDVWKKARNEGYGMASLKKWARMDNSDKYISIMSAKIAQIYFEVECGGDFDIARIIHYLYKDEFVCVSIKNDEWYQFQNHTWVEVPKGYTLKLRIHEQISQEFMKMMGLYSMKSTHEKGVERDIAQAKTDVLRKLSIKLKSDSYATSIMKICTLLFYKTKFTEILDSRHHLLGFINGVYDLDKGELRDGVPEDYVSKTIDYDFPDYSDNHPKVVKIKEFFEKVHLDEKKRIYTLKLLASYLHGGTKEQKVIIWTGKGANGKSKTVLLFQFALQAYAGTLPNTILTQKRAKAGAAEPNLADKRGVRFVVFQEPEKDDQIHVGFMKELSGGDYIEVRPLYKEPFKFRPQFKMLITVNQLPSVDTIDGGTWRRLRVLSWDTIFTDIDENGIVVETGKPRKPNEFQKDDNLDEMLDECKDAFIWWLATYWYPLYKRDGNREPEEVLKYTKMYQQSNDSILEFMEETYEASDNDVYVLLKDMHKLFVSWMRDSHRDRNTPTKMDIAKYLDEHDYKVKGDRVYGIKMKGDDAFDDD